MSYTPTADDIMDVRTLTRDTSTTPVLSDDEILSFLRLNGYSVRAAAAEAAEGIARNGAKLKLLVQTGVFKTEREGSQVLLALADSIRTAARKQAGIVSGTIRIGQTPTPFIDTNTGGLIGPGQTGTRYDPT